MNETDQSEWGLLLPFLDESESFVLGFEVGKMCCMCEAGDWPNRMMAHTKNVPQIELAAKRYHCDLFVDASMDPEWCDVTFAPRPATKLQLVQPLMGANGRRRFRTTPARLCLLQSLLARESTLTQCTATRDGSRSNLPPQKHRFPEQNQPLNA